MSDYRHGSHTTFSIHLHIVWITKYRHKVLRGEVANGSEPLSGKSARRPASISSKGTSPTMSM